MKKTPPFIRLYEGMKKTPGGCWEWLGQVGSSGYGNIKAFGRTASCHRLSYELYNGPIPHGVDICHTCDNRRCINPDHLFVATHKENMRDMIAKGRRVQGAPNPRKGAKSSQSIQVMVLGCAYGSIKEAEKSIGASSGSVKYWLKTGNPKARVISLEEFERVKNG